MEKIDAITLAQQIVRNALINFGATSPFQNISAVYRFTNEDITAYFEHLKNKEKVCTVIGSGSQIINGILAGSRHFDCFDMSIFPEYYLFLQLASIQALTKEEYLEYYFSEDREVIFGDDFYDKLAPYLKEKYRTFWDHLYMFDEGYDIYNSLLFRSDVCIKDYVISLNPYLQGDNYDKVKEILNREEIIINPVVGDIRTLKFDGTYDLVNLSNIMEYICTNFKDYIDFLRTNFNLTDDGEIINYLFKLNPKHESEIQSVLGNNGYIEDINGKKLLVYKK